MKKVMALALVLLIALSVFAQGASEAKAEPQTLVVSTWGTAEDALMEQVYEPFEKMYNCKVVLDLGTTADRYNKLINDPNTTVDIVELNQESLAAGLAAGIFQAVSKDELATIYPELIQAGQDMIDVGAGMPYTMNAMGIFYNPEVTGFEIKSWKDLWDPRLEGKIAAPVITSTFGPAFVTMCSNAYGVDIAEDNGATGFKALADLKKNIAITYAKSADVANLLQNGEISVAIVGDFAVPSCLKGDPNGSFFFPEEGTYVNFNAICMTKNCKNRDLALKYMNYRASKTVAEGMLRAANETPINKTVQLTAEEKANIMSDEDLARANSVDWTVVSPVKAEWVDQFNKILNQ